MFISTRELAVRRLQFREEFAPGTMELGQELRQNHAARASGHAELVQEHAGHKQVINDIRLVGEYSARVEMRCARCLEPLERDVAGSFDLLYRPLGVDARKDESSINQAETEIGFYQGEGVLLEGVLKEQILLALPVKAVCREECKGLCPHCGRNLNLESCDCVAQISDPRWEALSQLKDKFPKH